MTDIERFLIERVLSLQDAYTKVEEANSESKIPYYIPEFVDLFNKQIDDLNYKFSSLDKVELDFVRSVTIIAYSVGVESGKLIHQYDNSVLLDIFDSHNNIKDKQRINGEMNRHRLREVTLKIAERTWDKYPSVSVSSLAGKLCEYWDSKLDKEQCNMAPKFNTICDWLKKSEFRPKVFYKKNYSFELVIDLLHK